MDKRKSKYLYFRNKSENQRIFFKQKKYLKKRIFKANRAKGGKSLGVIGDATGDTKLEPKLQLCRHQRHRQKQSRV